LVAHRPQLAGPVERKPGGRPSRHLIMCELAECFSGGAPCHPRVSAMRQPRAEVPRVSDDILSPTGHLIMFPSGKTVLHKRHPGAGIGSDRHKFTGRGKTLRTVRAASTSPGRGPSSRPSRCCYAKRAGQLAAVCARLEQPC
jgi:hypothetical protein